MHAPERLVSSEHITAGRSPPITSTTCAKSRSARAKLPRSAKICARRSEEHTSELQSLMRISYAVFCLKKKKKINHTPNRQTPYQRTDSKPLHTTHKLHDKHKTS